MACEYQRSFEKMKNPRQEGKDTLVKTIAVIGGSKTGKTSLISRFLGKPFDENHSPTVEDHHAGKFYVGDTLCHLEIVDTSGSFEFPVMERLTMKKANGYVFVYSLDDEQSFERVEAALRRLKDLKDISKLPVVIVCNKADLANIVALRNIQMRLDDGEYTLNCSRLSSGTNETLDINSISVVQILRSQIQRAHENGCKFLLTSAKYRWNVNRIFELLFQDEKLERRSSSMKSTLKTKREKGLSRVRSLSALMK